MINLAQLSQCHNWVHVSQLWQKFLVPAKFIALIFIEDVCGRVSSVVTRLAITNLAYCRRFFRRVGPCLRNQPRRYFERGWWLAYTCCDIQVSERWGAKAQLAKQILYTVSLSSCVHRVVQPLVCSSYVTMKIFIQLTISYVWSCGRPGAEWERTWLLY